MTTFVKLERLWAARDAQDTTPLWLNPDYVTCVGPVTDQPGLTEVTSLRGGLPPEVLLVKGAPLEIAHRLATAPKP